MKPTKIFLSSYSSKLYIIKHTNWESIFFHLLVCTYNYLLLWGAWEIPQVLCTCSHKLCFVNYSFQLIFTAKSHQSAAGRVFLESGIWLLGIAPHERQSQEFADRKVECRYLWNYCLIIRLRRFLLSALETNYWSTSFWHHIIVFQLSRGVSPCAFQCS